MSRFGLPASVRRFGSLVVTDGLSGTPDFGRVTGSIQSLRRNAIGGEDMSKGGKKNSGKVARSAVTGRFVTKTYAKSHPKTTVMESRKK